MTKPLPFLPAALALLCLGGQYAAAQDAANLQKEIVDLKATLKDVQKDLQEIKDLLRNSRKPSAPALPASLDVSGILVKGDPKAPVTIVEFTDMQCPFCSRHAQTTLAQIDDAYIKTGKLRYVVKDFPIESIHPNAFRAAVATHCAAEQNQAWEMHDRLFANQKKLTEDDIVSDAGALGMDAAQFKTCLESGKYAADIRKQAADAQAAGITGTPTFFVGTMDGQSRMKPVKMLSGALPFASFQAAIDELLPKK